MPFNLTTHDQRLRDRVVLQAGGIQPVSGFPDGGPKIVFQFPPKITTESKKMNWREMAQGMVWEPYYLWGGGYPREATLTTTYLVGGPSGQEGGEGWTANRVAHETRRWKSYFYNDGLTAFIPVFQLDMWQHAPITEGIITTWRASDISLKFSESLITDSNDITSTFPLRTDITLKLSLTTEIEYEDGRKVFDSTTLTAKPKQTWY